VVGHPGDQPPRDEDAFETLPRYDLGGIMRRKLPPPQVMGRLLYAGRLHTLSGPPEAGKTVLSLWLALGAMRAGHGVLMVDEETGPRQVADLLNSMGAEPELIDKHLHYLPFTGLPWQGENLASLHELVGRNKPRLAIFDSAAELLAALDLDENSAGDVTRFWASALTPIARVHGCSVLLIDHDAKGGDSRYSRGTGAKLAKPDVSLKLEALRPFSRDQDGAIKLTVAKDRIGCLHRYWQVHVTARPLALRFAKTTFAAQGDGGDGMSPATRKLLEVLDGTPADQQTIVDRFAARNGFGLRRETASRCLTDLLEAGLADRLDQGRGRAALWSRAVNTPLPAQAAEGGTKDEAGPPPPDSWPPGSAGEAGNS
jgi:AAA domain